QNTGQEYLGIERIPGLRNDTVAIRTGTPGADIHTVPARDKQGNQVKPLLVIIDTGLDTDHPDLADNLWTNPNELPDNGIDDDHNGFIDDIHGWDFSGDTIQFFNLTGDNDVTDGMGHGTHVAGCAAAVSNNEIGVAGVASHTDLLGLKIFPNAFISISIRAIMYAADMGADVINMSWGNYYQSRALREILEYAHSRNVLAVAAIGNFGDSAMTYPASYPITMAVGATNSDDQVTYFSSYGSWMDMCAPGLDILSLRSDTLDMYAENGEPNVRIIDSMYYLADGSSMAAPMVAGAAAEILSYSPGIVPDSLRKLLSMSADDYLDPYGRGDSLPGHDVFSGWGRLNLSAALDLVEGRLAKIEFPASNRLIEGEAVLRGTAFSEFGEDFRLYAAPASDTLLQTLVSSGRADILHDELGRYGGWTEPGYYCFTLEVGANLYKRWVYYTAEPVIEVRTPVNGDTVKGVLSFRGTVVAPGFEECRIYMSPAGDPSQREEIIFTSGYVADSLIGSYSLSRTPEGEYVFDIVMQTADGEYSEDLSLFISNGFAQGFPTPGKGLLNYGPAIYDMDGNGRLEAVVSSRTGIGAYNHLGGYVPGLWRTLGEENVEGPPAVFDINKDGYGEVAFVTEGQLHLLRHDGYSMPGFPKDVPAERGQNGYPTVYFADMDSDGYEEIIYASMDGEIYAYRHDGSSYFASLDGFFAETRGDMIEHIPVVFVEDFNLDGQKEMIVVMRNSISIFNTHNGIEPDWLPGTEISDLTGITGACMADFDGDSLLELGIAGRETENEIIYVALMEVDGTFLHPFPKYLERVNYLISYPAAADLDVDGKAEIIFTISPPIDVSEVWIVRSDGSTISSIGSGEDNPFASFPGTMGPPAVADVDGDEFLDVIVRQGNFFPGRVNEAVYAFDQAGQILPGWPVYTFADPNSVLYRLHMPSITNLGNDRDAIYADLLITADDSSIYAWELPVEYDGMEIAWGHLLYDSRHSGILPPTFGKEPPAQSDSFSNPPQPAGFFLAQNYPNPFNAATRIQFRLMRSSRVTLDIYNLLGQKIRTLADRNFGPGEHQIIWNGRDESGDEAASGVYFYRLQTNLGTVSRKMIMLK
ncbi:MAG TPA: T9SS type A sorting domain-containing protein, partial [candidate division Zixibacteria bacterium]|nr:T9SS type A sorting domain-containing protein [candidate division Zixibacteria bacterium]